MGIAVFCLFGLSRHQFLCLYCVCKPRLCGSTVPEIIKLFSYSTQPSTKFILLINVKMPTIVGILTVISRINTTSESLKARTISVFQHFSFHEQIYFEHEKRFITWGSVLSEHCYIFNCLVPIYLSISLYCVLKFSV